MVARKLWLRLHGFRVRYYTRELRFLLWWDLHQQTRNDPEPPRVVSPREAEHALRMNVGAPAYLGERVIEKLYLLATRRSELPSYAPKDLDAYLLSEVLQAVHLGRLVAVEVEQAVPPSVAEVEREAPPPPPAKDEPTWFEVRVVWDDTGEPVRGVALVVDPGHGRSSASMLQTDADGRIRVDPVPGACSVRSRADGLEYEECAGFTGTGDRPPLSNSPRGRERRERPSAVAMVERHRVRAGETLQSVASSAGLTWKKLAKFNFGTDDVEKVHAHLKADVGSLGRAVNESNFVFTHADEPGILLVPKPLRIDLLATGVHHVLRVMPIEPLIPSLGLSL